MSEPKTIKELAAEFLTLHAAVYNKPSEIHAKRQILNCSIIPLLGELDIAEVGPRHIASFIAKQKASGISNKTINNRLAVLKKMFRCAKEWELIKAFPDASMKLLRPEPIEIRFLSEGEISRLLEAIDDRTWYGMVITALGTGMRTGELRALQWQDIDFKNRTVTVKRANWCGHEGTPKNHRKRTIGLTTAVAVALKKILHNGPLVFSKPPKGDMYTYHGCREALLRFCEIANLKDVGWHTLRHTFASHLIIKGASLRVVQELMGHSDITMTMRYSHLMPSHTEGTVNLLDTLLT